jgi:hypothetical protein
VTLMRGEFVFSACDGIRYENRLRKYMDLIDRRSIAFAAPGLSVSPPFGLWRASISPPTAKPNLPTADFCGRGQEESLPPQSGSVTYRIWASSSFASSPATVGLVSGSCSSARIFAPRFFRVPPHGECDFTLALRYDFSSIRLSTGLSPSSCRTCSAQKGEGRIHADPAPEFSTVFFAAVSTRRRDGLAA